MPDTTTLELEVIEQPAKKIDGRTTRYHSDETKTRMKSEIIEEIALGTPEAVAIRDSVDLPSVNTFKTWRDEDEAFASSIAHARLLGHDAIAVDCLKIADDSSHDTYTDEDGKEHTNSEVIQRSKLRVETRLKLLSKWDPKRYGDKVQHEVNTKTLIVKVDATLTPEDASEAYKELMG